MKIYRHKKGVIIEQQGGYALWDTPWDPLLEDDDLVQRVQQASTECPLLPADFELPSPLLPPVLSQEIWAAGVTYYRSREARMEEAKDAGGGDFYDRVYGADRPELFFKSPAYRAVGHGGQVRLRRDSGWNVPEPELTLVISANGKIVGYTIGNDMSSRDIEGENPLYLPQAKSYDGSTAVGPGIWVTDKPIHPDTQIRMDILREGGTVFSGQTEVAQIKRRFEDLVGYLFRETSFPHGCLLMTGTGVVPPDAFTLAPGDEIRISIDGIGTLINTVAP